jgi:hypothetical protein
LRFVPASRSTTLGGSIIASALALRGVLRLGRDGIALERFGQPAREQRIARVEIGDARQRVIVERRDPGGDQDATSAGPRMASGTLAPSATPPGAPAAGSALSARLIQPLG